MQVFYLGNWKLKPWQKHLKYVSELLCIGLHSYDLSFQKIIVNTFEAAVVDIAWCQNVLNYDTMVVSLRNGFVYVCYRDETKGDWVIPKNPLTHYIDGKRSDAAIRVGFTQTGNVLQVNLESGNIVLYKENICSHNQWTKLSEISVDGEVKYD